MTPPKTHSDFQQEVCFSCFTKPAKEGAKFRAISDSIKTQIIDSGFFPQYGSDKWSWLPTCICESCRKKLAKPEARGPLARRDYDLLDPPTNRRNLRSGHCNCSVCYVGRLNGRMYLDYRKELSEAGVGLPPGGNRRGEEPEQEKEEEGQPILLCSTCFGPRGQSTGTPHVCNKSQTKDNIIGILNRVDETTQERVVSEKLKEKVSRQGGASGSVTLATGGPPITASVRVRSYHPPPRRFTHEALNRLQQRMGSVSDRGMRVLDNFLRIHGGRKCVETNRESHRIERNQRLEEYFDHTKILVNEYYTPEGKKSREKRQVEVPLAYCTNVEALAMEVMHERGLRPEDTLIQLGIDDGQGLVKASCF